MMPMLMDATNKIPAKQRARKRLLTAALLVFTTAPAWAVKPFSADYQASYMGLQGNGKMTLVSQGANRWKYTLTIDGSLAKLSQSTVFEDRNGQWRPLSSNDSSTLLIKRVNKDATYDWNKGEATWSGDVKADRAGPIKLQTGDMDALMINLALARDVAAGTPMNYRMVDDGRAKQLSYQVVGKEAITIDGKTQQATKVIRNNGNRQTTAWVVEGLPVPARILQTKDGKDDIDLRIRSVR